MSQNCDVLIVAGTRPNFIKISPLVRELDRVGIEYKVVNTGQHYDANMSDVFFVKPPDIHLDVGEGNQITQTARIMEKFEKICTTYKPKLVIVVGDVTSTIAASLVVCKIPGIKLAHIEAGGRSFNREMPEETNRIVTDALSDYLFAIEPAHVTNLIREGIDKSKIFLVGDNIIDNLLYTKDTLDIENEVSNNILVTVHRQNNTDNIYRLVEILKAINVLATDFKIRFPVHPRTMKVIADNKLEHMLDAVDVLQPLSYSDFVKEMLTSLAIITDSGGVTIEAAVLGVPCVVLRKEIERNFLVGSDASKIIKTTKGVISNGPVSLSDSWANLLDGNASNRIVKILKGVL